MAILSVNGLSIQYQNARNLYVEIKWLQYSQEI